jgi:hypothetical protein
MAEAHGGAMRISKLSVLALFGVVTLGVTVQVSADASPPLYPPGSDVLPPGETMVQMVSETVEINIVTPSDAGTETADSTRAQFAANFTLRNQGAAAEQMDVRFPLTDGDSWETIWDFAAFVDGERVRVRKSVEPYMFGDTRVARWAVFPVTFEPGAIVSVTVTYSTRVSGWGYRDDDGVVDSVEEAFYGRQMNPDTATVYYVLETGARWYGPIETGTIVLRVPYPAGPANVFPLDSDLAEGRYSSSWGGWATNGWSGEHLSGPVFTGKEARWEFSQLEPAIEDNLKIQFLWPKEWQRITTLQAAADRRPEDPATALSLAGAYLAAGADVYGGVANPAHCALSREALDRGLAFHSSSELLLQALDVIGYYCPGPSSPEEEQAATGTAAATSGSEDSAPSPSATPTTVPTVVLSPTAEVLASATAAPTAGGPDANEATRPTATTAATSSSGSSSSGVPAVIGIGLIMLIVLILVAARSRRTPG